MSSIIPFSVRAKKILFFIAYCAIGILLNLLLSQAAQLLNIPAAFDTAGTMAVCLAGGMFPGVIVGFFTNVVKSITKSTELYYTSINMFSALIVAFFARRQFLKSVKGKLFASVVLGVVLGGISSVLTWFLNSGNIGGLSAEFAHSINDSGVPRFLSLFIAESVTDLCDKGVSLMIALILVKAIPEAVKLKMPPVGWWQSPLDNDVIEQVSNAHCRSVSLRTKILLILMSAAVCVGGIAIGISYMLYKKSVINDHKKLADGVAELASACIDAERVNDFIDNGENAEGYSETKRQLYQLRESMHDIEYLYVYQIREDGCHVVFDLDTEELQGSEAGDIVPFDESFEPYLPTLLKGGEIDPIITDDTFGWLLTVYRPVRNAEGECVCYACTDVSMNLLETYGQSFFAKQVALLVGFFVVILAIGQWLVEYQMIVPVNTMAYSAGAFAYNSDEAREESVNRMKQLGICTGDEIENLYNAFLKTIGDSMNYVDDIQNKTETISKMQNGLIMVLADMVESRDKCTGDHVRKTAAYVGLILREMKKKGYYPDQLTDEFAQNTMNAAPLHDIGKIKISDVILNKPGKLTDEEYEIMKTHTTMGSEVIDRAAAMVPDSDYLREAKNVSMYHHEKWNGKGYPKGLSGEDIPLSARIMAVADVFDALVSQRSYKKPFSFEKALNIIREDAGSHFDPLVADAFIGAEEEVRKIAEDNAKNYTGE